MITSFKILFLFILISLLNFSIIVGDSSLYFYCNNNETNHNTTFQLDLKKSLFSSLSSKASGTQFDNNTIIGQNPSDSIYGLFMCRGDVSFQLCQQCVGNATEQLSSYSECSMSKEAVIWYDECMVRYSNRTIFSSMETFPTFYMWNLNNITDQKSFNALLSSTMDLTAEKAANSLTFNKKYATKEANISASQILYFLAQCTPDLSPEDCKICLNTAIAEIPECCEEKQGGRVISPSCNIRYETYPFYLSTDSPPKFIPATKSILVDSEFSEDPVYLHQNCSTNKTSDFDDMSLKTLFSYLSSNATKGGKSFYKTEISNYINLYGLYMCRGDLPSRLCGQCVLNATKRLSLECRFSQEAIIWFSHCMVRYSGQNFFSRVNKSPVFSMLNITDISVSSSIPGQNFFAYTLSNTLASLTNDAADDKYLTQSSELNDLSTLYTLVQCTQDLSSEECKSCLQDVIGNTIPWSRLGSVAGRVLYPSCNLRFELFPFYRNGSGDEAPLPSPGPDSPPPKPSDKKNGWLRTIILIVVSTIASLMLFSFGYYYLLKSKKRRRHQIILRENYSQRQKLLSWLLTRLLERLLEEFCIYMCTLDSKLYIVILNLVMFS